MIIEVKVKNCFTFPEEIIFSLKADMRNKKFASNVHQENGFNVLKSAGIYGANNVGKTCLIKCIESIRNVLLNKENKIKSNIFQDNSVCELSVTFLNRGKEYVYSFHYNPEEEEFLYEQFSEIQRDKYGNEKEEVHLLRDTVNRKFQANDKELEKMLAMTSKNNVLIYLVDTEIFEELGKIREILVGFASKIDIVDMNRPPIRRTIELFKNQNKLQEKVVEFVKSADLDLEDFRYSTRDDFKIEKIISKSGKVDKEIREIPSEVIDQMRLTSVYKGKAVPSVLFDSIGTKKIVALASYIIEAIEEGRILVVDELDSSLHFKLTRAIVAMFNNELNSNAQMIFTVHDINLMDCKRLFRKEQVWFVHKDKEGVYVYSLADFTAAEGVRDTSDIMEKYRKGALGALPEPELINSLLSIKGNKTKGEVNE